VHRTEEFRAAFEEAIAAESPWLLELRVDPQAITPSSRLSELTLRARH
jgi:acetolactate synthase I/II/III large subunit